MGEKINFKTLWHAAGVSAIALASVSIAYFLISARLAQPGSAVWMSILNYLLMAGKIFLCVWLMFIFLARFKNANPSAERKDLRHLGMLIAFLSALIFSTVVMAYYRQHPALAEEIVKLYEDILKTTPGAGLDSNAKDMLRSLRNNFPNYMFVSELIYCYLFGWVLSAILAAKIDKSTL